MLNDVVLYEKPLFLPSVTGHVEAKENWCTTWVSERPRGDVLCVTHCVFCVNTVSHGRLTTSISSRATHAGHESSSVCH